ncbi:MAG: hypothetical protein QQN63_06165 [Nitrosopumilus sp.]
MAFELSPNEPEPQQQPKLSKEGLQMIAMLKLSMDEKIIEQGELMWADDVFVNCLKSLKETGLPLPEKKGEIQALIRLILAANETTKVKRILDYKY